MGLNRKINKALKNMPKYKINEEAFQNQNIARSRAFGRDRSIQMQEGNIEQQASNDIGAAKDITSSTSGLLSAISNINANKTSNLRNLAQDESQIQSQNVGELYGANQAMIDEKDKEFNQNVVAPWDAKMRALQQRKANRAALTNTIIGTVGNIAGAVIGAKTGGKAGG